MNLPADASRASHEPQRPDEAGPGAVRDPRGRSVPSARTARPAPDDLLASRREARWNFRHSEKLRAEAARGQRPPAGDALVDEEEAALPPRPADPVPPPPRDREETGTDPGRSQTRDSSRPPADEPAPAPFPAEEVDRLRRRWRELQSDFVDDPPGSVQDADRLVGDVLNILTAALADQRRALAERGDDAGRDTEELRLTLRAYRSFLDRLLRAGG
ncbi:hypothetical protein [Marinitenerispora sediminis]|uniref:Uncharacterized protein n=1 Tax=Marinitenerispora sediminis TaxID=1931232 RepID=A0A368T5T1_9ACTN|nr:hypothetical protein [Marinitenerispora sediminis]RCV57435.1 hypothetical protein DEF28_01640 [Marinitenerispora sediminis]RCV58984.1 hypothetical protein DEF24_11510 [Marinitenerispora sediminis]RCV61276.1 hypothetical protein DEF23_02645 [Marinitenerispora sediminis]